MKKDFRQLWVALLMIGDNGDLLRGICYGKNRKRYKLKVVVSYDEFCEKRVMLYRREGKKYLFIAGYEYYQNSPDAQWIDIAGRDFVQLKLCNRGAITLDVYCDFPESHILLQSGEKAFL